MIFKLFASLGSVPVRLSAGIASLLALAVMLEPATGWSPDWDRFAAFLAALALWVVAEARSIIPRHPHDVRLMELIQTTLPQRERAALRTMEMSEDFQWTDFAGLQEMATWEGPDHAFLDRSLQARWQPTLAALQEFRTELARRSMPKRNEKGWYSVRAEAPRDQWEKDAAHLNAASDALTRQLDTFIVHGRRRLSL